MVLDAPSETTGEPAESGGEEQAGPSRRPGRKAAQNVQNLIDAEKNDSCKQKCLLRPSIRSVSETVANCRPTVFISDLILTMWPNFRKTIYILPNLFKVSCS